MKKITFLLVATMMYITSCTTGKYTASREYDDVYYSKADKVKQPASVSSEPAQQNNTTAPDDYAVAQNGEKRESIGNDESGNQRFDYNNQSGTANHQQPDYSTTQQQDGNTYVTNNYYNDDDYYDYAYSSRMRRFYHPCGWGYYDTYYTNSYWYDYNPYSWGVSIYLGYNWWQPQHIWTPNWGMTIGNGYPGYYGNDPWFNPYNGGGFGYGAGFNQGYQNGYMNGYYNGLYNGSFNPYYYNSFDSYSYYYGPRGRGSSLNSTGGPRNISQIYANNTNGHLNTQPVNQASSGEQPFIKIKNNTQPIHQIPVGISSGSDVRDTKGNNSEGVVNTGGVKPMPNVKGNDSAPIKVSQGANEGTNNSNPSPIKVPNDIKSNQNSNNDGAPIKNPSNIKVNHNIPVKTNPEIRNENEINPGNDIRNVKSNPSEGIIKNPNQNTPIRNNSNDHSPVQPGNNSNGNIRTPRGEQPIRQNNSNENTPVKSTKRNDGSGNDRSPSEQPVKNQPQYNNDQRNNKEQNEGQKPRSERVREKVIAPGNTNSERNSNPTRIERNVNQQQSAPVSQPRQAEQRNSNNNGNKIQSRPRH